MKSALVSLAVFATVAFGQTLTINTPANVVECEPTLLSWSGGTGPYFLSILPGNQPTATALENLGQQSGTSLTWKTDIAAGTSIGLTIRDSTGATASSAAFSINSGSDTSCLNGGGSSSASGSSSSAATSSGASSAASSAASSSSSSVSSSSVPATTKPTTTATTPAATSAKPTSAAGTTTGASGSSSTGAASVNVANMGVAGVIGAAVMAILA